MSEAFDPRKFSELLAAVRAALPDSAAERLPTTLPNRALTRLVQEIVETNSRLERVAEQMDPIRPPPSVLDPTDPKTTGMLIGMLLEQQDRVGLGRMTSFYGSGAYAIYYDGPFHAYQAIRSTKCPIYVGKADPARADARTPRDQGPRLFERLSKHAQNIGIVGNLELNDFTCAFLVVQSGWQKGAEDYLIQRYRPVWNSETAVCPGLGKHGDRARAELSAWDVLHPGRAWAGQQSSRSGKTAQAISDEIEGHFRSLCELEPERWLSRSS